MWAFKNALTFCFPVHFGEEFCFLLVGGRQLLYRSGEKPASPAFTGVREQCLAPVQADAQSEIFRFILFFDFYRYTCGLIICL